jgi:AraC family transcriptional regulator, regulatory protein of adaptative response / methylated-DNA-[protein]-cysteine methyltransferase
MDMQQTSQTLVRAVVTAIDQADEGAPTLATLSEQLGVSPFHLQRAFKRAVGISPREYAEATRLERFKIALKAGGTVAGALYEAGYGSSSRLYESATRRLGMTPASYGKGGKGADIAYATARCSLGLMLVAATERGICRIAFADDAAELEDDLAQEYPLAIRRKGARGMTAFARALAQMVDAVDARLMDLPLDVRTSAFQARVWQCLRDIPPGETRTYSGIAAALGDPKATRAVARACATNPVAVTVPCHRAVGADGSLRGYRWGLPRKRKLLDQEKAKVEDR